MSKFFDNLTNLQKSLIVSILSIILFVASASASYSFFAKKVNLPSSSNVASTSPSVGPTQGEDPTQPKTESCPLNGSMHTKAAKDAWDQRRPLAVMIENSIDARPQSGLTSADVVYETVAEGGITRFMAVFYCTLGEVQVGPVRSARIYFIDWLSEYNALYAHVGGANTPGPADALDQIIKYNILDLNQFSIGYPTYWRDYQRLGHPVATEHTMYSTTYRLWDVAKSRGWTNLDANGQNWDSSFVKWSFKDDSPTTSNPTTKITVPFWSNYPDYTVVWQYDQSCNCYKRFHGSTPHLDLDNNQQLSVKNVVVQFETETSAHDGYTNDEHQLFGTIGKGKALIFQDGKVIQGSWSKPSRTARSKYTDSNGKEIQFNKGQIWIQTVPMDDNVQY